MTTTRTTGPTETATINPTENETMTAPKTMTTSPTEARECPRVDHDCPKVGQATKVLNGLQERVRATDAAIAEATEAMAGRTPMNRAQRAALKILGRDDDSPEANIEDMQHERAALIEATKIASGELEQARSAAAMRFGPAYREYLRPCREKYASAWLAAVVANVEMQRENRRVSSAGRGRGQGNWPFPSGVSAVVYDPGQIVPVVRQLAVDGWVDQGEADAALAVIRAE